MADANIEIVAQVDQALEEIEKLAASIRTVETAAKEAGPAGESIVSSPLLDRLKQMKVRLDEAGKESVDSAGEMDQFAGSVNKVAKALVVIQAVGAVFTIIGKGIEALDKNRVIEMSDETRAWAGSFDELGSAISRLDVVGVGEQLGKILGGAIVDLTDMTQTLTEVNQEAAESLRFMGLEGTEAANRLRDVLQVQRDFVALQKQRKEQADIQSEAIRRQAEVEAQAGAVTKVTADEIKRLLDFYQKRGEIVPPELQAEADKLNILSTAQEKAAAAAEKEAAAAEKAAAKHAKEAEEAAKNALAHDPLIAKFKEFAEGKSAQTAATEAQTKALREEVKALEENARAAEAAAGDAQKSLEDAQARRAELEGKPVLSVEEAEELLDLQTKTSKLEADAANTAENAAQASFEYGTAQTELAGATDQAGGALDSFADSGDYAAKVNRELAQANADLERAMSGLGDEAASTNEIVETIGEDGERKFSNVTEAAGEFGDVLVKVGDDGQYVMESIERGAEGVAQAAPAAADGIAQVGDELRNLPDDKDETGLGKARSDAEAMVNTLLPRMLELLKECGKEAAAITLGGQGAGL